MANETRRFRRRLLVTEGDLYTLFAEVEQIRKEESRELYREKFRQLLADANLVELKVVPKIGKGVANG